MLDLSIIIINWNTKQLLLDCIASVERTVRRARFEVIVVDNGSADGSVEAVGAAFPGVRVIANSRNYGFAAANNMALKVMRGRYALLLNSDTILKDGAADKMFDFMESHSEAGICGPQLLNGDGSKQKSIGTFPTVPGEFISKSLLRIAAPAHYKKLIDAPRKDLTGAATVDFIMGACMLVSKQALDEVGMLDEEYFFFYEEIDWCYRMNLAGWSVYHIPNVEIIHLGGQSTKDVNLKARVESWRSRYLFFIKNYRFPGPAALGLHLLGFTTVLMNFATYTVLNAVVLFTLRRLRRRWQMFGYLLKWHILGFPLSMGLPH